MSVGQYSVALIRGINVGRAKRIEMSALRACLEANGFFNVSTLLNSGNVLFTGGDGDLAERIGRILRDDLGVAAEAVVLPAATFQRIMDDNPLVGEAPDYSRLLVTIYGDTGDRARFEPLAQHNWQADRLFVGGCATYAWCDAGALKSRLAQAVSKAMGPRSTTRNWATLLKLQARLKA